MFSVMVLGWVFSGVGLLMLMVYLFGLVWDLLLVMVLCGLRIVFLVISLVRCECDSVVFFGVRVVSVLLSWLECFLGMWIRILGMLWDDRVEVGVVEVLLMLCWLCFLVMLFVVVMGLGIIVIVVLLWLCLFEVFLL